MKKIAFLDLDLTLFDYTRVREEATRAALETMNLNNEAEDAIKFMNNVLIPYGDVLADVGLPNFRREWKAPELFTLFLLLSEGKGLAVNSKGIAALLSRTGNGFAADQGGKFRQRRKNLELLSKALANSALETAIFEVNEVIKHGSFLPTLNRAIDAFNCYLINNAEPFDGVHDLLMNLRSRGFDVYIASEGEETIQQEKMSMLGLRERSNGTYVSSSCCDSEHVLSWIWNSALEARTSLKAEWLKALEVLYDEVVQYSMKTSSLFRKILHTVLLPDSHRQKFYRQFGWLSVNECSKQEPVYILLFGDRYDKDLQPAIDAFENTISVRLLAGKYSSTYQPQAIHESKLPEPTATVYSVIEGVEFINNLPALEHLPSSRIIAPRADERRQVNVHQALEMLSSEPTPSWLVEQLQGLQRALAGSEIKL